MIKDFNHTIDIWINGLEQYNLDRLCVKPSQGSWSLGQVYMHLIRDTNYYLEQIKICISANDHEMQEASPDAKKIFFNNDFPDKLIEGSPSNLYIPNPDDKEQLVHCLMDLKEEMNAVGILISKTIFKGKTKHPGLGYLNANEWFQFAEMHFRHHLRQKKRIDDFVKICNS